MSDPRAGAYIAKHGRSSWEVDALDPATTAMLISRAFESVMDMERYQAVVELEKAEKAELRKAAEQITEKLEREDEE